jgi:hypothetical protein
MVPSGVLLSAVGATAKKVAAPTTAGGITGGQVVKVRVSCGFYDSIPTLGQPRKGNFNAVRTGNKTWNSVVE